MAKEFYRLAKAYDIAFGDREFDKECDFLEFCFDKYCKIENKNSQKYFLELGAGPARHVREMARRGWNSTALDISEDMCIYAFSESKNENLNIKTVCADIIHFDLPEPVSLTATLMESISHILTNDQMISHLKSVSRNLLPGGLYIIEATHPMHYFPDNEPNSWTSYDGGTKVEITFGDPGDYFNTVTQIWNITSKLKITGEGTEHSVETKSQIRWYLAQEIKALIDLSGEFDECFFFGSLYSIPPCELDDSEKSDSMVIVLRKK